MIPPVVGPATRSTSRFSPPALASVRREEATQLARRRRILEDLELLDIGIAVAAGLEQKVALAKRARSTEQGLGAKGDRVPDGGIERGLDGRHRQSLRGLGAEDGRVDPADLGDGVERAISRDDLRDPFVQACREVDDVTGRETGIPAGERRSAPHQCVGDGKDGREQILGSFRERRSVGGTSSHQVAMEDLLDDFSRRDALYRTIGDLAR